MTKTARASLLAAHEFGAFQLAEISVERAEGEVTGPARDFDEHAVGKTHVPTRAVRVERRTNHVGVLQRQIFVIEQQLYGFRELSLGAFICRLHHPNRFGQRQVRDPRTVLDESFGGSNLLFVVSDQKTNQHVGINGAHASSSCTAGFPLSIHREYAGLGDPPETERLGRPRTSDAPPGARQYARRPRPTRVPNRDRHLTGAALPPEPKSVPEPSASNGRWACPILPR